MGGHELTTNPCQTRPIPFRIGEPIGGALAWDKSVTHELLNVCPFYAKDRHRIRRCVTSPARLMRLYFEPLEQRHLLAGIPIISEFMAKNDGFFDDGDGNSPDWIEIQNVGDETLDLAGYRLTDKPDDLSRWTFPSVTLQPGEYRVVFASGQDVDNYSDALGHLHTNFSLSADGEFLALVDPNGTIVSQLGTPSYPPQRSNLSYGIAQDEIWVSDQSTAAYWVPVNGSVDDQWTLPTFDPTDHGFLEGRSALGYDRGPSISPFHFRNEIGTELSDESVSVYARMEFDVQDVTEVKQLKLQMKYDDGFVAYLNGVRVAEANAPIQTDWTSRATRRRTDRLAFALADFDVNTSLAQLVNGTNVLAIHGFSADADSSGMLIAPRLTATAIRPDSQPGFMTLPTPGYANSTADSVFSGLVGETTISADAGFYDAPFQVTIDSASADATIRYTTDGSRPTAVNGTAYTGSIQIDTTTTLRAASFLPDHVPSKVASRSFLFLADVIRQSNDQPGLPTRWQQPPHDFAADYEMDQDIVNDAAYRNEILPGLQSIRTMSITMDPKDFLAPDGIYIDTSGHGVDSERAVSVEIINPDGSMAVQVDAGLRNHGNRTRDFDVTLKQSFRLVFSPRQGPRKLDYQLFEDSSAEQFDNIILHAGKLLDDPQLIRNSFGRDTNRAMGNVDAHSTYVHLYLNGLYWGLYNAFERIDAEFAQTYFGGSDSDYDAILNNIERIDGDMRNYSNVWRSLRQGLETQEEYEQFERQVNLDSLFDHLLINQYMAHNEHELRAIGNREGDADFRFFIQDVDEGGMQRVRARMTMAEFLPGQSYDLLREHTETRLRYADRAHKHLFNNGALTPAVASDRWEARYDEIHSAVIAETARWGDTHWRSRFPRRAVQRDIELAREGSFLAENYFPRRTDAIIDQLRRDAIYPEIDAPEFDRFGGTVPTNFGLLMSNPNEAGVVYYTQDGTDPRQYGGEVHPSAAQYVGNSVTIRNSSIVKARVLADGEWSALTEASFETVAADINQDGVVAASDLDALCVSIRSADIQADVNSDGHVDLHDLWHFVKNVLQTEIGDSNLDGSFALDDLRSVEYEDGIADNSTWAEGDWNCDQDSTSDDFVWALSVGPSPTATMPLRASWTQHAALRSAIEADESHHPSSLIEHQREDGVPVQPQPLRMARPLPRPSQDSVDSLFARSNFSDNLAALGAPLVDQDSAMGTDEIQL